MTDFARLKIGFVFDDTLDEPDGVQQYILTLGKWLRQQGHEVHYLVGATQRTDIPNVHSLSRNIQVRFNGNRLSIPRPADKQQIRQLLAREKFDVLHVQMPYSPMLAAQVIKSAGKQTAIVGTFHILPLSGLVRFATRLLGVWLRPTLRRFDRVYAVSSAAHDFAVKAFALQQCDVLPNVADVDRFARAHIQPATSKLPTIMFLGRLVPRKGCATLIEAAALLQQRTGRPFRVIIAGKGPLRESLQELAVRLKVDNIIEFTGFVEETDKAKLIAQADIMTFPSTGGESFGIVLIEAMAAGRPVVLAGDNPGYRSVLQDRPDQLFPPGDAKALADKLQHFIEDPTAHQAAVTWQQQHVRTFDVDAVGKLLVDRYCSVLRDKSVT